jgi:formylglycine-generating enzyme required for sulfatase activity
MGATEVTQAQYKAVVGNNPAWFSAAGGGRETVAGQASDSYPVENVSWLDATQYCDRLSKKDGLAPYYDVSGQRDVVRGARGSGYRLPTEAEWEFACRAGTSTKYSFESDPSKLGEYAWYSHNSSDKTHNVGEKLPNAFGLHDMHGNVWEWCWDSHDDGYYRYSPPADPRGPPRASDRVARGGGWANGPSYCRSAARVRLSPAYGDYSLGLRLARGQSGR